MSERRAGFEIVSIGRGLLVFLYALLENCHLTILTLENPVPREQLIGKCQPDSSQHIDMG